jgi:hypothetical protein
MELSLHGWWKRVGKSPMVELLEDVVGLFLSTASSLAPGKFPLLGCSQFMEKLMDSDLTLEVFSCQSSRQQETGGWAWLMV